MRYRTGASSSPGGAGAVSDAAIQLARWAGATVITTVGTEAKAQLAIEQAPTTS